MGKTREATDTIIGYYYQFDYFILQLLEQENVNNLVCIEGIEDVDIDTIDEKTAVQCKYYAKTEFNNSLLGKPIRFMLMHYAKNPKANVRYMIYGHYQSGQNKLPSKLDVDFLKQHFLTFTENKIKHELHSELGIDDSGLSKFLTHLTININAKEYEEQIKCIIHKLKQIFSCGDFEAEYYFYNNALKVVKDISTRQSQKDRNITKQEFIQKINCKDKLYNIWFLKRKGMDLYCKEVKREYFTFTNISPYERFFLIDCDEQITNVELKTLIERISSKWSNISPRSVNTFCPYIFLNEVSKERLLEVKMQLQADHIVFKDGFDFKDSPFNCESICIQPNNTNGIVVKVINDEEYIDKILERLGTIREIYQFYINKAFYENSRYKHIKIPIVETVEIMKII